MRPLLHKLLAMKCHIYLLLAGSLAVWPTDAQTNLTATATDEPPSVETLVLLRHAEKPPGGLGQLTVQGLNRALALPDVLLPRYGKPDYVFAPNPSQKADRDRYYYVRPLATIEPTAIRCGLPVDTEFGFLDIAELESELGKAKYRGALIYIAWEHVLAEQFAKKLLKDHGGDPRQVPRWSNDNYDMIFVFKITHDAGTNSVTFTVEHEGLNNLSSDYPKVFTPSEATPDLGTNAPPQP
jgi:hypothetical protein